MSKEWIEACRVGQDFRPTSGNVAAVADAVRRGADLRRFSTYSPQTTGLVQETMTLQTTWVIDNDNAGGLATLRQPVDAALGFLNEHYCMAYWIFNVTAPSGMAFVPLNGRPAADATGKWVHIENHPFTDGVDAEWLSREYRWWVRDDWREIFAHDEQGNAEHGTWRDVQQAANEGRELKVGLRNPWEHLMKRGESVPDHEVFMECSVQLAHIDAGFFGALTTPTLLVRPCKPLKFTDEQFEPGWLLVRTDGKVCRQTLNPSTMQWERTWTRHPVRWFTR